MSVSMNDRGAGGGGEEGKGERIDARKYDTPDIPWTLAIFAHLG